MKNERIVCLVPSLTELLVDLQLGSNIVGATNYCVHPAELQVNRVAGTKNPDLTKIIELRPSYLLCNREENRREDIEFLRDNLPNCYIRITEIETFEDGLDAIKLIAEDLDVISNGDELIVELKAIMRDLVTLREKDLNPPIKVLYLIWKNPWMTVGCDTYIYNMLKSLGFEHCVTDLRYPSLEDEQLIKLDYDLLLLSSEPYPFKSKHVRDLETKTRKKVFLVNGEHFSWYGSRLKHVVEHFTAEIKTILARSGLV